MNAKQKLLREEKFCEIRNAIKTPEHLRKFTIKVMGGMFYNMKFPLAVFPPGVREKLESVPRPTGWRVKALTVLTETMFGNVDPNIPKDHSSNYVAGINSGMAVTSKGAFHEIIAEPLAKSAMLPFLGSLFAGGLVPDEVVEQKINEYNQNMQTRAVQALGAPQAMQDEYFTAYKRGMGLFAGETPSERKGPNFVCGMLLFLDNHVERFTSVKELYEFLGGPDKPADFDTFRKICQRIGFQGSKYSRSRGKKKLGDRAKRHVH